MKRSPSSLSFFIKIFILILSVPLFSSERILLKDAFGTPFIFESPPTRIVSLSPAITEILYFIGAGNKVVGVTRYCDFPEEARKKEKVGGLIDVDIEKILRIDPDIVFVMKGNPLEIIDKIKGLGTKVFALKSDSLNDIFDSMEKISLITGNLKKSKKKIGELKKRVKEIELKAKGENRKPKLFMSLDGRELWTCGKGTFINDLILRAGCKNIADFREGWFQISMEALIKQNPDIIILPSKDNADFSSNKDSLLSIPGLQEVNAMIKNKIFPINIDIIERPGPRIIDALEELYKISHELPNFKNGL
ncbi:MAG: ABC transporter substrate-binding protein [Candidatus Aminicenantia bacterium]